MLLKLLIVLAVSTFTSEGHRGHVRRHRREEALASRHGHLAAEHRERGEKSGVLKNQYPFYHTSDEIRAEAARLSTGCGGAMSFWTVNQSGVSIDVARVHKPGTTPVNRVFIMFGEHSRELISPESGLHLLRVLCGEVPAEGALAAATVLEDSEFQMVLNGNPRSRRKVESGDFCLRTNPDGVDLNRNWDEMWSAQAASVSVNSGPRPFSEPETQIFRELVTSYRPTTFLTVHSGTRGLYMPWAFDMEHLATRNQPEMLSVLRSIDEGHCQCPYGAAGREVGYSCPGTCLDWVYDKLQTPYSFAFEIYTSPDRDRNLKDRWDEKVRSGGQALLEQGHHLGHPHFLDLFQTHTSDFVQTAQSEAGGFKSREADSCFAMFNPDTQEHYDATVQNWAAAYLEMSQSIAKTLRQNATAA